MSELKKHLDQLTRSSTLKADLEQRQDFNHIELDEDEIEEALRSARENKHYRLVRMKYLEDISAPKVYKSFTADEINKLVKAGNLDVDAYNEQIIDMLCLYFAGDPRFNNEKNNLKKGLMLFGGVGVGKTTLMRTFSANQVQSYKIVMCRAVEDVFSQEGDKTLTEYSHPKQIAVNANQFGHQHLGICFDDLGTEPMSKYYGKETNVMAEIILNRYDNEMPFNMTHITTNLSIEQIKQRYGTRVTDRMREMFNLIEFPTEAKSRRK